MTEPGPHRNKRDFEAVHEWNYVIEELYTNI